MATLYAPAMRTRRAVAIATLATLAMGLWLPNQAAAKTVAYEGHLVDDPTATVWFSVVVRSGKLRQIKGIRVRGVQTCASTWKTFVDEVDFRVKRRAFRGRVYDPGWSWGVRGRFDAKGRTAEGTVRLRTPVCDSPPLRWRVRRT